MALSSGSQRLLIDLGGWVVALGIGAVAIVHFSEVKAIGRQVLGLPAQVAAVEITDKGGDRIDSAERAEPRSSFGRTVELRSGSNGHFVADADINGRLVSVMVDTGASMVALSWEDAQAAGVTPRNSDFTGRVNTANGVARVAPITLDRVSIGNVMVRNVRAVVSEPGALQQTLLGMSFLGQLRRAEMRSGRLVLEE